MGVGCGDTRESRAIASLRACSTESAGVIIAASEGPTSESESESCSGTTWGSVGLLEGGDEARRAVSSDSSRFRFRFASRAARRCGGSWGPIDDGLGGGEVDFDFCNSSEVFGFSTSSSLACDRK